MADQRKKRIVSVFMLMQKQSSSLVTSTAAYMHANSVEFLFKRKREFVPRIKHYYEQTIPLYTLEDFKSHFRLTRGSFEMLLRMVENARTFNKATGPTVNTEKELLMFLWYLGNLECFRSMADRFGVSKGSYHAGIRRMSSVLVKEVMAQVIQWPRSVARQREASVGFSQLSELQGVIGALDGTHIQIKAPVNHAPAYYNRKKFHSLILLAACDHNTCFTYAWTGNPGSTHDATVLRSSDLFQQADNLIAPGYYVLGDSAFPLTQWLMTPFRDFGNLNRQQRVFNTTHAKARVPIERAFGLLKCRFRRLFRFDASDMNIIVDTILSACILHNFCIRVGDNMLADNVIADNMMDENCFDNNDCGGRLGNNLTGIRLRQELMQQLQVN